MANRRIELALVLCLAAPAAFGNTYTVTSTADSGAGTLREAIMDANANPGGDTIQFGIVGSGVHTIALASSLPDITDAVTIDGYTQAGSSANTNPTSQGLNTVLQIEIDGSGAASGNCLVSMASDVTIRGLNFHNCPGSTIQLAGAFTNNVVAGNILGLLPDGMTLQTGPNTTFTGGVSIGVQTNARVGGTNPADRNLISGFRYPQVRIQGGSGHLVQGNLIGTDISGLLRLVAPNSSNQGIAVDAGTDILIGGPTPSARNVVAVGNTLILVQGNTAVATVQGNFVGTDVTGQRAFQGLIGFDGGVGIGAYGSDSTVDVLGNTIGGAWIGVATGASDPTILGNFIGTDSTGTLDLGNQNRGIEAQNPQGAIIGGIGAGEGNIIAFNGHLGSPAAGIVVTGDGTATIRGNAIYANRYPYGFPANPPTDGLGIDLDPAFFGGVTPNDVGDADSGPNGKQNFPVITSAVLEGPQGSGTRIQGTLNSAASTSFDVDFYRVCNARPQDMLEGHEYMGSTVVTTDGSGNGAFDVVMPDNIASGESVTATATDPSGNTSEFSQHLVHSSNPLSGPSAGGTSVTLKGMLFEAGATVTVGGVPAANVVVTNETTITANMPALPPGTVNDTVVSNPSGSSGTLTNAWVADFLDVNSGNQFYKLIRRLVRADITAGTGGGNYGVNQSTLRQQMAVFLLKGKYGVCYAPPPCTGVFPDVSCPSNFAPWIEALAAEGITGGCGGGNYCPLNAVLRQQMAVFLLKAKHGSAYVPPLCSGDFADVPCPGNPFADWIEQLAAEGITGGCGAGNFCPTTAVTRGQMAAFLAITFTLPF